ncbi:MAG: hypothetical protein HY741_02145 [Chloroflexi bacterium]|nr:hypothetical protein [Chloroflexota bacterium]
MKFLASYNLHRTLVAILSALVALLVVVPLVYDLAGVRTNLEEYIAPTQAAERKRKTRVARAPTPTSRDVSATRLYTPAPTKIPATPAPPLPTAAALNGVPVPRFVFLSDETRAHVRDIFALGQALGRDPRAISKVGDSTMVYPEFLAVFDRETYQLGKYAYLQTTIDYHAGTFARTSIAAKKGMHTWSEFDPAWSLSESCATDEGPLACEVRLNNPSIAVIRLGANDTEFPGLFERHLGLIVKYCLERGIIPVLGTKPDHLEGESNLLNKIIRKTASAYSIPLWDYDLLAGTVPDRGLEPDLIHIQGGGTRDFRSAAAMRAGDALEDLSALMVLDAIRREVGADVATSR